jgi:hypothetical protein
MRKLALFDLDGTINTSNARSGFIPENRNNNAAWLGWHKAFHMERLNLSLIRTADCLAGAGYEIGVVSNRDESVMQDTHIYLKNAGFPDAHYHLRNADDNRRTRDWKVSTVYSLLVYSGPVEVHMFDDDLPALKQLRERFQFNHPVQFIPHHITFK